MDDSKRLIWIDTLRVFAITLVVWGHFPVAGTALWFRMMHDVIYSFHMPLFLFISGYLYMHTSTYKKSYFQILRGKVRRLVVPYFTVSILLLVIKYFVPIVNPDSIFALDMLYKMFYSPAVEGFMWFLWVLFTLFLIVPLLRTCVMRLCFTTLLGIIYLLPYKFTDILALDCFQDRAVYFMFGILAYDFLPLFKRLLRVPAFVWLSVFVLAIVAMTYLRLNSFYFDGLRGIAATTAIMFCVNISQRITFEKHQQIRNIILRISAASFIIYLLHIYILNTEKYFMDMIPFYNASQILFASCVILSVAISMALCYMLYKVIKSNRYTAFLFGEKF